jgi:hypothetical protein
MRSGMMGEVMGGAGAEMWLLGLLVVAGIVAVVMLLAHGGRGA